MPRKLYVEILERIVDRGFSDEEFRVRYNEARLRVKALERRFEYLSKKIPYGHLVNEGRK